MKDRNYWVETLFKIINPVFRSLADERLKIEMPVESPRKRRDRNNAMYLEAVGRSLAGIGPFLENTVCPPSEDRVRTELAEKIKIGLGIIVDPKSPDCLNFRTGTQPLVDAAFLAQGIMRAPKTIWAPLPAATKQGIIAAMQSTRVIKPHYNNWLLFSAMIEAFLAFAGQKDWDRMRVDYAVRQHLDWYKGDGVFGDGPEFHFDYYNSYVIQPMLIDILDRVGKEIDAGGSMRRKIKLIAKRHTEILERLISPEGTFPPLGRSLTYRFGNLHLPAQLALKKLLPKTITPAALRCAMTAVIKRVMDGEGVFDESGWLTIGVRGTQPALAESYISRGSLYLCTTALLPLGLPETSEFWSAPKEDWTSVKFWKGENIPADQALGL